MDFTATEQTIAPDSKIPVETPTGLGFTTPEAIAIATGASPVTVSLAAAGIVSDTDLSLDGTAVGADQSPAIQTALDQAEEGPLHLFFDVAATAKGLLVRSNTTIELAAGCGIKLSPNADTAIISNLSHQSLDGGDPEDATFDDKISIRGLGTFHGNPTTQEHDTEDEGWTVGLRFLNVRNLELKGFALYKPRTFSIQIGNAENVALEGLKIDVGTATGHNYDGPHFNGPIKNLVVRDCSIKSMDDAIGICSGDVDTQSDGSAGLFGPGWVSEGDVRGVLFERIHLNDSGFGFRFLSAAFAVDDVVVRDTWGEHGFHGTLIDNYAEAPSRIKTPGVGAFGRIVIDGWTARCTGSDGYHNAIHAITCSGREAIYRNILRNDTTALAGKPTWRIGARAFAAESPDLPYAVCAVERVEISGYRSKPAGGTPIAIEVDVGRATIGTLALSDVEIGVNPAAAETGVLVNVAASATIGTLIIDGCKSGNAATLVWGYSGTTIGSIIARNMREPMFWEGGTPATSRMTASAANPLDFTLRSQSPYDSLGLRYTDAMYRMADILSADVSISGWFAPSTFSDDALVILGARETGYGFRGTSRTGYQVYVSATAATLIISGGSTLATVSATGGFSASAELFVDLRCKGATQMVYIRRGSDMQWLQADGSWAVTRAACLSAADATKTGRNVYVGSYCFSGAMTLGCRDVQVRNI